MCTVAGALGVVWSVLWLFLTADSPSTHPRIDPKERDYIEHSQGLLASAKKVRDIIMCASFSRTVLVGPTYIRWRGLIGGTTKSR